MNAFESVGSRALGLVYVIALHVRFATNVGGLWRDEANSIQDLANSPLLRGDVARSRFRFLSHLVLNSPHTRGWTAVFGKHNDDLALRVFGLTTGLGILGAASRFASGPEILRHQMADTLPRAHRIESNAYPLW